jgi:hypothetical protein
MPLQVQAQSFRYSIRLQEVTFLNDDVNNLRNVNLFPINKDDGSGSYVSNGQPHWTRSQAIKVPIAYQSGTKPRVTAQFKLECSQAIGNQVQIRGNVRNPVNREDTITTFATLDINPVSTGGTNPYTYDLLYDKGTGSNLAKKIRYIENYTIQWEISFDNGSHWNVIDAASNSNTNELYVTWKKPLEEDPSSFFVGAGEYYHLHTLFHLSCTANDGVDIMTNSNIFDHVWKLFDANANRVETNSNLKSRSGEKFVYYNTFNTPSRSSFELIQNPDGQCYAFASLLLHLCKIQGMDIDYLDAAQEIQPDLEAVQACGGRDIQQFQAKFLVKNWNFTNPSNRTDCSKFPIVAVHDTIVSIPYLPNPNRYIFIYSEISDAEGLFGQNNRNPNSFFGAHAVVKFNGKIYDPSYGIAYNSIQEITKNLSAWAYRRFGVSEDFFRRDLNGNGNSTDIFNALFIAPDIQVNKFH